MAEPLPLPPYQTPTSGLDRVRALIQALLLYIGARGKLFQIEAGEAGGKLAGVAIGAVVGLAALAGAWLLLVPAAIGFAVRRYDQPWEYVAGAVGGVHLLVAVIFLLRIRSRLRGLKLFEESLNQFERDRSWVGHKETQPK
ncbi:MAG: hypothetical protein JWO94_2513 [Verrucomicrobiaceae bacterium]|nr:hypothetical protein [Verrucomicrobiaceae bacterium]